MVAGPRGIRLGPVAHVTPRRDAGMVRRHLRLFGLSGLLLLLALGCRAAAPRRGAAPVPQPIAAEGTPNRPTLPDPPASLAINDAPPPAATVQQPPKQLPQPTQVAQNDKPAVSP